MALPAAAVAAAKKWAVQQAKSFAKKQARSTAEKNSGWLWFLGAAVLVAPVVGFIVVMQLMSSAISLITPPGTDSADPNAPALPNCTTSIDGTLPGLAVDPSGLPTLTDVTPNQAAVATTIIAAVHSAGGDRKAVIITLMVAAQESTMGDNPAIRQPNSDGDVGVFQQRGKLGWYADGKTVDENTKILSDPAYGAKVFYIGHTITKAYPGGAGPAGYHIPGLRDIKGWQEMPLTVAAQNVQRSAFGDAYAKWEAYANLLYDTYLDAAKPHIQAGAGADLTKNSQPGQNTLCGPSSYSTMCAQDPSVSKQLPGVKPDTLLVALCAKQHFPKLATFYGVRNDALPYHPAGKAVDLMTSGIFPDIHAPEAVTYGDQIADYLVKNASALGIDHIIWRQHIWSPARSKEGWRLMEDRGGDTENHFDHLHVATIGNASTQAPLNPNGADTVMPLKANTYTLGPAWGATGSWASYHTGQDFAAGVGVMVYAVQDGVIVGSKSGTASWCGTNLGLSVAGGDSFLYCHLSGTLVKEGDRVTAGQPIGLVGQTGRAFGPHLHFEHYPPGITPGDLYKSTDPIRWLAANGAGAQGV